VLYELALRLFASSWGAPIAHSGTMDWAQVGIFFAVATFAGIVLFVMYRKPPA
jgi:hypothetical protein